MPSEKRRPRDAASTTTTDQDVSAPSGESQETKELRLEIQRLRSEMELFMRSHRNVTGQVESPRDYEAQQDLPGNYSLADPSGERESRTVALDCSPLGAQTDTFELPNSWSNPIALASQVRSVVPSNDRKKRGVTHTTFTLSLPPPAILQELVDGFFSEYQTYFPYIRRTFFQERMTDILRGYPYTEQHTTIAVEFAHCYTFALLCNMMAISESVLSKPLAVETLGFEYYLQGLRLMQHFQGSVQDCLELAVYHTVAANFMIQSERLRLAAKEITLAIHVALSAGLNDETRWEREAEEVADRTGFWWALFYLDRRIHQKCGIPYILRENDMNVGEPDVKSCPDLDETECHLLTSMYSYAKLWTSIWDANFAAKASSKEPNWHDIRVQDAHITISYDSVWPGLQWDTWRVQEYLSGDNAEIRIRQRLIVYLRFQFLRLGIRHRRINSGIGDAERRMSNYQLACDILRACEAFVNTALPLFPFGYVLTTSLVECLSILVREDREPSACIDKASLDEAIKSASTLLRTLARSAGWGRRACATLQPVLRPQVSGIDSVLAGSSDMLENRMNDADPHRFDSFPNIPNDLFYGFADNDFDSVARTFDDIWLPSRLSGGPFI
ncbi:hypothetical protein B0A52_03653 [Exophiala mesophila]|uniref:Xylanolytic transcriptional activator regulatory domain-containing protein n=1 Tax=Exophiala mesophila TaxID=212818 RepID=A0A438N9L1_EXOME|nr:hypothetical protein B0A52_03653 [Exophiala mesophila]